MSGVLYAIRNHSINCSSCISNCIEFPSPVCRFSHHQQAEKPTCSACQTCEDLWMCVNCGFVGCGRYKEGHATRHWKETEHRYSVALETRRVWDYTVDNFVPSKTDGGRGSCECANSGFSEALLSSSFEAMASEYNDLLATQQENQKLYFESLLKVIEEETEKEIYIAVEKALKLQHPKVNAEIEQMKKDVNNLGTLNENLWSDVKAWIEKIDRLDQSAEKALKLKDDKIKDLEEELHHLMSLDTQKQVDQLCIAGDVKDNSVSLVSVQSSSGSSSKVKKKKNKRRN